MSEHKDLEEMAADDANDTDDEFELTENQKAALEFDDHVAVTAGAGTGKTTTLTSRYVELLENDTDPSQILTITFTTDAAAEIRERVREAVAERLNEAVTSNCDEKDVRGDDIPDYERWRTVANEVEDCYVHTIHEACARLRSEFSIEAGIHPDVETLDEAEAGMLARDVVRESIDSMLVDDHERRGDLRLLTRLWSRSGLETVLIGLLESRPMSTDWADRWCEAAPDEYLDTVWRSVYPVDTETARELLTDDRVQQAFKTISDIDTEALGINPDEDDGADFIHTVNSVLWDTGVADGTAEGRDWQMALDRLCDRVTTGGGTVYSQEYRYKGAKKRWKAHGESWQRLKDAADTLIDVLDPDEREFVGGLGSDYNGSRYAPALARVFETVAERYTDRKDKQNAVDFDDLIEDTITLLTVNDDFRDAVQSKFKYVMIDEMQDTDPSQWALIRLIAGGNDPTTGSDTFDANLFLVGDEKQSIYRFRGADVTTFGTAREALAEANSDTATKRDDEYETDSAELELTTNFRTVTAPRKFNNEIFERVFTPFEEQRKPFEAASQSLNGQRTAGAEVAGSVEYLLIPNEDEQRLHETGFLADTPVFGDAADREAHALAARLTRLFADPPEVYDTDTEKTRKARPEDVTILFRARTRLPKFERALNVWDVPYTVASGTGFWDTPEIRTLIGLFEVLATPDDDVALYGLLRSPLFGFTDDEIAHPAASEGSLWTTIQDRGGNLGDAAERIEEWREQATVGDATAAPLWGQLLSGILAETGYLGAIGAGDRPQQAVENVEQFREQVRSWADGGRPTLAELLTRIRDRREVDTHASQADVPEDADGVRLRTIHSAKGLEFPIVVVPEVGREFNFGSSVDDDGKVYLEEIPVEEETEPILGLKAPSPNDPYESVDTLARSELKRRGRCRERAEQKRLLYVAATRARDCLLLCGLHELDDDAEPLTLSESKPHGDGKRWRDWLQPVLLGDGTLNPDDDYPEVADTLDALSDDGVYETELDEANYTVRVPPAPLEDWRAVRTDDDSERDGLVDERIPCVNVPEADISQPPVETTATTFAETVAPDPTSTIEGDVVADTNADPDEEGLAENHVGTVVHELLEHRPPREDWRAVANRRASGLGDPTTEDLDLIVEYAERGLSTREALVKSYDPNTIHEEVSVIARFDAGRVVGEIDLLLVTDERFVVLDYKTDETSTRSVDDLAEKHWPQLEVYAVALAQSDPNRTVETVLYFTDADTKRRQEFDVFDLEDLQDDLETRLSQLRSASEGEPLTRR
ncbi:UvrD-helicase domain-containing protein (plasmid) [Haladaptatus sp. SPP-AMP-3]|uniref:UvrD-helicase domain-containing protein n=1 Tax=Haladaptatus sp. SPP-AMP-3 TaxID=3121295 RepID=UPI003C2BE1DB